MIGQTLSHFEITAKLGKGGMGEVWRATDSKLGREVAIKVLPEAFVADAERLARFEREARVLASLSHTNIAGIFEVGEQAGVHFLVMELAEGETLAERIARGPLAPDEAVDVAVQMARGLEAAHEQGIVHRDLKPANVKVDAAGQVKILDFGLAKALAPEGGAESGQSFAPDLTASPTLTQATAAGMLLGTAAYMSPEQARGKPADSRADIWAFGVVLWEMLTGKQLFGGETVSDVLARVLTSAPDPRELPAGTPDPVRWVVGRCLEPQAARRLRHIGEARLMLSEPDLAPAAAAEPSAVPTADRRWKIVSALLAAVLVAGVGWQLFGSGSQSAEDARTAASAVPLRAALELPDGTVLGLDGFQPGPPALAPDGRALALVLRHEGGPKMLWIYDFATGQYRELAGTEEASYPFWSPDGASLGFFADNRLERVDREGGAVLTLCEAPSGKGGAWRDDGTILFSPTFSGALFLVDELGGEPRAVTTLDSAAGEQSHRFPQFLPDGDRFLYTTRKSGASNEVRLAALSGGPSSEVLQSQYNTVLAGDMLLYVQQGFLMGQRLDLESGRLIGRPSPIADSVAMMPGAARGVFTAVANGPLVYGTGALRSETRLQLVNRSGDVVREIGPPADYSDLARTRDGSLLAVAVADRTQNTYDIWTIEPASGRRQRITFSPSRNEGPVFSPGGDRIAFISDRNGKRELYVKHLTSGEPETLLYTPPAGQNVSPESWSPDGRTLLAAIEGHTGVHTRILAIDLDQPAEPRELAEVAWRFPTPTYSPNGELIAYTGATTAGENSEVFVLDAADPSRRWQLTTQNGALAAGGWSPDGRELFYQDFEGMLWAVPITDLRRESFAWGEPEQVFNAGGADLEATEGGFYRLSTGQENLDEMRLRVVVGWERALGAGEESR